MNRTILLTSVAMAAFAGNSLLARAALAGGAIDAGSFTAIRLAAGAAALAGLLRLQGGRMGGNWISALALLAYALAFSLAYLRLTAATGALILFAAVQGAMILWSLSRGDRPSPRERTGLAIAFAAFVALLLPGLGTPDPLGSALMTASGIAWGVYSIRGRGAGPALGETAGNFLRAALACAPLLLPWLGQAQPRGILLAAASGVVTSGLGYALWYRALAGLTTTQAATVQLTVPLLAAIGAVLLLAEPPTLRLLLAGACILGGVAFALLARPTAAAPEALHPAALAVHNPHAPPCGERLMIAIHPGQAGLADWRGILAGAGLTLPPACRDGVERGAATIGRILHSGAPVYGINTGFGKLASVRIGAEDLARLQRNIVLSHAAGVGAPLDAAVVRLVLALKAASLAQGASGVRWAVIERLLAALQAGLLPVIPGQGSVGASGDLAPLAHMAAALFLGVGEAELGGQRMDAAAALARAGLPPLALQAKEGLALLNGTQVSTALALSGLFAAETLLRAGLVTGALSTDAARGSDGPFDPRIHALRRHAGQIEVAAALRALMAGSAIRDSHREGDARIQDPYCLRCQPQVMGACLDLLRQAADTLAAEANGVSDNPLVFADTDEVISGGNFHAEPVAFAADMIALALCEIGSIAERRVAMLTDPALSGLPAFLTSRPGLNSGFMLAQVTAAALVAENRQRATPASVDSIPTSANQEDHVSMATHGARRLAEMAANTAGVLGIELLAAAQGCDFHAPLASSAALQSVRARLRAIVPRLDDDRYFAPDIAAATALVRAGALADTLELPSLERPDA